MRYFQDNYRAKYYAIINVNVKIINCQRVYERSVVTVLAEEKKMLFARIGGKVAYYRKMRGLTQISLAEQIHVSRGVISRLEGGRYNNNISLGLLVDVAEALDVELSLLLEFDEKEKKTWWGNAN